jgi:hypothetical protein
VEVRDAPSAPAVFESAIAIPTATGPYNAARLSFQPSVPGHESATPLQRLSFAMKVTAFEDNPGVTLAGVRYGAAESYIILSLSPHMPTGVDLTYFYTGESVVRVLAPIELDTWVTLTVSIAPRSSTMSELVVPGITVEVDGVPTTLVTAPGAVLSEDLRFDVGLSTTNPEAHLATVQYDDVTIDYL